MEASFSPVPVKLHSLTVPALSKKPVINMYKGGEVSGSDVVAVTPHSVDSLFFSADGRDICNGLWSVDTLHGRHRRRPLQRSADPRRLWSNNTGFFVARRRSDSQGSLQHRTEGGLQDKFGMGSLKRFLGKYCVIFDVLFQNLFDTLEMYGIPVQLHILSTELPYNIRSESGRPDSEKDVFRKQPVVDMLQPLEGRLKPEARANVFCSSFRFCFRSEALPGWMRVDSAPSNEMFIRPAE